MKKIFSDLKVIATFFIFPALVLNFHIFLMLFSDFYFKFPSGDIFMHFIGGAAISFTYFLSLNYLQKQNYFKMNKFIRMIFVLALVSLTAVFWEFFEFSAEYLTGFNLQGSLNDTMVDLFLGLFGGLLAVVFLEAKFKRYF